MRYAKQLLIIVLVSLFTVPAFADEAGDKILAKVDEALNRHKSLKLKYTVATKEKGKDKSIIKVKVFVKGEKRLSVLLEPGDMKGMKVLNITDREMYVYLPAYKKIRRVASHATEAGFMGTAFSQADMNLEDFVPYYTAAVISDSGDTVALRLTEKAGSGAPYPRIDIVVDKKRYVPWKLEYYNTAGAHVKTEKRKDWVCDAKACVAQKTKMTDHTDNDKWSTLNLTKYKVNPKIDDKYFTKRYLRD